MRNRNACGFTPVRKNIIGMLISIGVIAQTPPALCRRSPARNDRRDGCCYGGEGAFFGNNGSPLERYLFAFLLAGGGLICAIAIPLSEARVQRDCAQITPEMRLPFHGRVDGSCDSALRVHAET